MVYAAALTDQRGYEAEDTVEMGGVLVKTHEESVVKKRKLIPWGS